MAGHGWPWLAGAGHGRPWQALQIKSKNSLKDCWISTDSIFEIQNIFESLYLWQTLPLLAGQIMTNCPAKEAIIHQTIIVLQLKRKVDIDGVYLRKCHKTIFLAHT